jgi:hypothetical protein
MTTAFFVILITGGIKIANIYFYIFPNIYHINGNV